MKLTKENIQKITQFAKHCIRELGLKTSVKITLSKRQTGQATAGYYNPQDCTVFVAVHNRAIADIMRTLAHELTHCKQQEDGIEFPNDDEDEDEDEEEPEPKTATRKPPKKEKVVVPSPTVTPVPASKKNKKETRH